MTVTHSLLGLHLQYRLWIAEMNNFINSLRIFNDYISHIEQKHKKPAQQHRYSELRKEFGDVRAEIDSLNNEMHLIKMKLAAFDRDNEPFSRAHYEEDDHASLHKRCLLVAQKMESLKTDLLKLSE